MPILETFPTEIRSGDTVKWRHSSPDFSPADGWALSVSLITPTAKIDVVGVALADGTWLCTLAAADNVLAAGHATWAATLTNSTLGERYTEATGAFQVLPNLAASSGADTRSHARIVLDAVCARIEGRAGAAELEMTIGDKAVKFMSHSELLALKREYSSKVKAEAERERIKHGGRARSSVRVRFS